MYKTDNRVFKGDIMAKDFWEDVWQGVSKQARIQAREEREKAKQSSNGGRSRGRSRGYFSSSGRSAGKSQGMGRTSRISSSSYKHQTSVVIKKIQPNGTRYSNAKTIRNALSYVAGLSEEAERKNENVKLTYYDGFNSDPMEIYDNQRAIDTFYRNLENDTDIPTQNNPQNPPLIQHIVFSVDANTLVHNDNNTRENISFRAKFALENTLKNNEIFKNHMILVAEHSEQKGEEEEFTNGIHFHILKSNFNNAKMELDKDFWSKDQIRNLQRQFAENCQKCELYVKIPPKYEKDKTQEINEKQRQTENLGKNTHKVLSIEYYKNKKAKSLVLKNLENGEIIERKDQDISRFVEQNDIKVNDEFKVNLRIEKSTNRKGKEYTKFIWEPPIEKKNPEKEKEEKEQQQEEEISRTRERERNFKEWKIEYQRQQEENKRQQEEEKERTDEEIKKQQQEEEENQKQSQEKDRTNLEFQDLEKQKQEPIIKPKPKPKKKDRGMER